MRKNSTIRVVILAASVLYEKYVLTQNIVVISFTILMKLFSKTTKNSRPLIMMIFPVVITKMEIFLNGDSNYDREIILRHTRSDNEIF